jgi:hypothetical protein
MQHATGLVIKQGNMTDYHFFTKNACELKQVQYHCNKTQQKTKRVHKTVHKHNKGIAILTKTKSPHQTYNIL